MLVETGLVDRILLHFVDRTLLRFPFFLPKSEQKIFGEELVNRRFRFRNIPKAGERSISLFHAFLKSNTWRDLRFVTLVFAPEDTDLLLPGQINKSIANPTMITLCGIATVVHFLETRKKVGTNKHFWFSYGFLVFRILARMTALQPMLKSSEPPMRAVRFMKQFPVATFLSSGIRY